MIAGVPFNLSLRDGPDRADLASAEFPVPDLVTQRGSRQPESVGGFVEGEHLDGVFARRQKFGDGLGGSFADHPMQTGDGTRLDRAATVCADLGCIDLDALLLRHLVLLRGCHVSNLHALVYGVKRVFA